MTVLVSISEALDALPAKLGVSDAWQLDRGTYWLNVDQQKLRALTTAMTQANARFITITATELAPGEGVQLDYHWDLDGRILGFRSVAPTKHIPTISDLSEAADWIEREIHDGWAVEFDGRVHEPLLLRQHDTAGVNLRQEAV